MKENRKANFRDLYHSLHPYIFVLKEGFNIEEDLLDYKLLMLRVCNQEVIPSPGSEKMIQFLNKALTLKTQITVESNKIISHEKP